MPIIGLTDKNKEHNSLGRIEIQVAKGERKTNNKFGPDLKNRLRIATTNRTAAMILAQEYLPPDNNGDFLTESLRIYFPYDEIDRTFVTSMKSHSHSGLEIVCDRYTITNRCIPTKDDKGNVWRPIVEVNDPCPMRGKGFTGNCPNGCQKQGQLYFYIKELLDRDLMIPARITVHSYEDIVYLTTKLEEFSHSLRGIVRSPFPSYKTRHKIPFILSRTEVKIKRPVVQKQGEDYLRTGKKTDGTTWALSLQVDPEWMRLYQQWQLMEEMRDRQLPVSQTAIAGLLRGDADIIDAEIINATPLLPEFKSESEKKVERLKKMRSRICALADEYKQVTGIRYELKDLSEMSEESLIEKGMTLKADVDAYRNAITHQQVIDA
jgi:hypothetical protein